MGKTGNAGFGVPGTRAPAEEEWAGPPRPHMLQVGRPASKGTHCGGRMPNRTRAGGRRRRPFGAVREQSPVTSGRKGWVLVLRAYSCLCFGRPLQDWGLVDHPGLIVAMCRDGRGDGSASRPDGRSSRAALTQPRARLAMETT